MSLDLSPEAVAVIGFVSLFVLMLLRVPVEIGRASCRERV